MTFLVALWLVLLITWIVFAIVDRIVGWAFARGERRARYPEDFLYADVGKQHREIAREVDRLSSRVPAPQYPAPVAGPTSRARGAYRSRATTASVGSVPDRQSEYGQSTSLIGSARVEESR